MFKFQIKTKSDFFLCFTFILGVLFLSNFTYAKGFWASLKAIETKVSQIQAHAIDQQKNQYLTSSKITTDLFHKNLKKNENKIENSITIALKKAQNYIFEHYNKCELSQEEIISYIYLNDTEFKQYRDLQSLKSQSKSTKKDQKSEVIDRTSIRADACLKLAKCIQPNNLNKITIAKCNTIVKESYTLAKIEAEQYQHLELTNLWANKYQNGDKKDADYDILFDINQVGKIFFNGSQWFKDAPTTIFYQSPDLSTSPQWSNNSSSTNNQNTFKQNTANQDAQTQHQSKTTSTQSNNITWLKWTTTTPYLQPKQAEPSTTEDEEINQKLPSLTPNIAQNLQNETLFANQCLPPGSTNIASLHKKEKTDLDSIITSLSDQQNSPQAKKRIQDYQNAQNALAAINKLILPTTSQNNKGSNPEQMSPQEQKELKEALEACTNKCEAKDKKGDYQLAYDERQICKLQCLCGERSSPQLDKDVDFPILEENALKIRFCTIPAKAIQVDTNAKKIYSIAEIIHEILTPISELNHWGRLSTRQKREEFLDSEFSPKDISKNAAIIVSTTTKNDPPITSEKDKKVENQEILNVLILPANKNSYLTLNTPLSNIKKSVKGEAQKANNTVRQINDPDSVLARNNQADLQLQLSELLSIQQKFLSSFQESLKNINATLTSLENKKK